MVETNAVFTSYMRTTCEKNNNRGLFIVNISVVFKDKSRTPAISTMELFVSIVNAFRSLVILTKNSMLGFARVLNQHLVFLKLISEDFLRLQIFVKTLCSDNFMKAIL